MRSLLEPLRLPFAASTIACGQVDCGQRMSTTVGFPAGDPMVESGHPSLHSMDLTVERIHGRGINNIQINTDIICMSGSGALQSSVHRLLGGEFRLDRPSSMRSHVLSNPIEESAKIHCTILKSIDLRRRCVIKALHLVASRQACQC
mmetsp:Transcript_63691/g.139609  ORF Transcript_63691/g.139609 Transcript_63691/m.139609 type:complete len:147 (-) Transcript_63691:38-478(-)